MLTQHTLPISEPEPLVMLRHMMIPTPVYRAGCHRRSLSSAWSPSRSISPVSIPVIVSFTMSSLSAQTAEETAFAKRYLDRLAEHPVTYGDDFVTPAEKRPRRMPNLSVSSFWFGCNTCGHVLTVIFRWWNLRTAAGPRRPSCDGCRRA